MMYPKQKPIRSRKLRESARGQDCTLRIPGICSGDPEKVMLCHPPIANGGMGTKASDDCSAFGCWECHDQLDGRQRTVDAYTVLECFIRGHMETLEYWHREGLVKVEGAK